MDSKYSATFRQANPCANGYSRTSNKAADNKILSALLLVDRLL